MDIQKQLIESHRAQLRATCASLDDYDRRQVETIFNYLFHVPAVAFSWGTDNFKAVSRGNDPGVEFTVNGFKFAGKIQVIYDCSADYYQVFKAASGDDFALVCEDVCFADLVGIIDREVETDDGKSDQYRRQANEFFFNTLLHK